MNVLSAWLNAGAAYLCVRLKEPSTYAGLAAVCATASQSTTGNTSWALGTLSVVAGALAVHLRETPAP